MEEEASFPWEVVGEEEVVWELLLLPFLEEEVVEEEDLGQLLEEEVVEVVVLGQLVEPFIAVGHAIVLKVKLIFKVDQLISLSL